VQTDFDGGGGDAQDLCGFVDTEFFHIPEQKYLAIDERQIGDGLLQELPNLFAFERLRGYLAPVAQESG